MCLYTNDLACKIAKEPITVYKIIDSDNYSTVKRFIYVKNRINKQIKLHPVIKTDSRNNISLEINKGYHSFKNIRICLEEIYTFFTDCSDLINGFIKISKFIIPKGSIYYENDYSIVSNCIIYKSDVSLTRIKLFHYILYKKIKRRL